MKVAITTDWLNSFGGAERVLVELHGMFPEAPIYTTVYDPSGLPDFMQGWDVRPSFLQRIPFAKRRHQPLLPLMPTAFESFDLSEFDVVVTASSAFSKGVITRPGAVNLCYCFTPPRYLWDLHHEYVRGVMAPLTAPLARWLRMRDLEAASRVDHFVAISDHTADRIRRHYGRDPSVVFPPVAVARFGDVPDAPGESYLVVSRLVGYKRVDLAIEACNRLGRRLIVAGDGAERRRLEAIAGPTVEFVGKVPDEDLPHLHAGSRALLFPGLEDFGITPVEAQAAGRPVVAYGRGGVLETVIDGETGVHFAEQTVESLVDGILRLEAMKIPASACRANATRFDAARFRERFARELELRVHSEGAREREGSSAISDAPGAIAAGGDAGIREGRHTFESGGRAPDPGGDPADTPRPTRVRPPPPAV